MLTSGDKSKERNKKIKVKAVQVEDELNSVIKEGLNRESIFQMVGMESELRADVLRRLREEVEVLSLQYNFPTKNDVANIARLLIQVEEKIDRMEEQMSDQSGALKRDRVKVIMEDLARHQAIVSQQPGSESKVVRTETGEYGG